MGNFSIVGAIPWRAQNASIFAVVAGLPSGEPFPQMVHMTDWLPTLCAMADAPVQHSIDLDGRNNLYLLRGELGKSETKRFWQWNRYTPLVTCNAAMRDGDWKLVHRHADFCPPDQREPGS